MNRKAIISLTLLGSAFICAGNAEEVVMTAEKATVITFPSESQRTYKLLAAQSAAGQWETLKDGIVGTGGEVTIFYKSESSQKLFFKVETSDGPPGQRSLLSLANLDISGENLSGYDFEGADLRGFKFNSTQFDGANLVAANISEADFTSADFASADLSHAVAVNVNMDHATLGQADLEGVRFTGGRVRWADFRGANLKGVQFDGVLLEGANFAGQTLTNFNFRAAGGLNSVDFTGANLAGADLSRNTAWATKFDNANLAGADLSRNGAWAAKFDNANLTGANFEGGAFHAVSMKNRDLRGVFLRGIAIYQSDWSGVNLAGNDLSFSVLGRAIFMADANFEGANLEGSVFPTNYGYPDPLGQSFTNINFRGANLKSAVLQVLSFHNCDFTGADLSFADLAGSGFHACVGLDLEQPGIRFDSTSIDGSLRTGTNPGAGIAPSAYPGKLQLSREGLPSVTVELEPPQPRPFPEGPISQFRISGGPLIGEYAWSARGRVGNLNLSHGDFGNYKLLFTSPTAGQLFQTGPGTYLIGTFTVPQ